MTGYLRAVVLGLSVVVLQAPVVSLAQGKPAPAAPAPIPAEIQTAKKVFVANGGGDEWSYSDGPFNGATERAYNQFYAAINGWGRFELVSAPADADLLFEIQSMVVPMGQQSNTNGLNATGGERFDPQFQLSIRDARTNALLWRMTEHIQWAILQGNRDKNFDQTLTRLVGRVQALVGQPPVPPSAVRP